MSGDRKSLKSDSQCGCSSDPSKPNVTKCCQGRNYVKEEDTPMREESSNIGIMLEIESDSGRPRGLRDRMSMIMQKSSDNQLERMGAPSSTESLVESSAGAMYNHN